MLKTKIFDLDLNVVYFLKVNKEICLNCCISLELAAILGSLISSERKESQDDCCWRQRKLCYHIIRNLYSFPESKKADLRKPPCLYWFN